MKPEWDGVGQGQPLYPAFFYWFFDIERHPEPNVVYVYDTPESAEGEEDDKPDVIYVIVTPEQIANGDLPEILAM